MYYIYNEAFIYIFIYIIERVLHRTDTHYKFLHIYLDTINNYLYIHLLYIQYI